MVDAREVARGKIFFGPIAYYRANRRLLRDKLGAACSRMRDPQLR